MLYPGCVGALRRALDLSTETEVGDLAHQLSVDEHVSRRQVAVDVVDLRQVLHAESDAAQHAQQLQHLELAVVGLKKENKREKPI